MKKQISRKEFCHYFLFHYCAEVLIYLALYSFEIVQRFSISKKYFMRQIFFILVFFFVVSYMAHAKPIRVGIAGMTHNHINQVFNYFGTQDEVLIVGFAEPNKALAMQLLKKHNLPESLWFSNLEELIRKTKPQAVCAFN